MLLQHKHGTARSWPATGALQGPSRCANIEAATGGMFTGGQSEDRSSTNEGVPPAQYSPIPAKAQSPRVQASAWHPPCCTPRHRLQSSTGQPHRRREKTGTGHTSKAWLQKGQELLPGPRFPSMSQPAKGYSASPESSSDSALQSTCAAALRQPREPVKKQAADDVASVPFCCSALLARKRLFQPPRRDPNLVRC